MASVESPSKYCKLTLDYYIKNRKKKQPHVAISSDDLQTTTLTAFYISFSDGKNSSSPSQIRTKLKICSPKEWREKFRSKLQTLEMNLRYQIEN